MNWLTKLNLPPGRPPARPPAPDERLDWAAAALVGSCVLLVFWSAVSLPPRNDHWAAYYVFQHTPGGLKGLFKIAAYFFWGHVRFQPLSHLILYFSHKLFHEAYQLHNFL